MEEKKSAKPHSIQWKDRQQGNVTGVVDVLSFDETEISLKTEQGMLTIRGKNLHISRLELAKGEVEMEGNADSIVYSGSQSVQKGSRFRRMFQ